MMFLEVHEVHGFTGFTGFWFALARGIPSLRILAGS
jgi:hypothetical protein